MKTPFFIVLINFLIIIIGEKTPKPKDYFVMVKENDRIGQVLLTVPFDKLTQGGVTFPFNFQSPEPLQRSSDYSNVQNDWQQQQDNVVTYKF